MKQNDLEKIQDRLKRGLISLAEANVEMILVDRFRLVKNSIPRAARKALNEAVKAGTLGHLKKDRHKPEAYFHPTFEYLAINARNKREREVASCCGTVTT